MKTSKIELRDLTRENLAASIQLKLAPEQEKYVASVVASIAESKVEPHYIPRVIYAGAEVVGFLMYCVETNPPDPELFWLFRLMIDVKHQAQGYGTAAIKLAVTEMQSAGAKRIHTMHKPENEIASRVYQSVGFQEIGSLADGDLLLEMFIS